MVEVFGKTVGLSALIMHTHRRKFPAASVATAFVLYLLSIGIFFGPFGRAKCICVWGACSSAA